MLRITTIALGLLVSSAADAQSVRLKNYMLPDSDASRAFNDVYLAGVMDGLTAYNKLASVKLFCKGSDEIVSHEEAAHMLTDWASKQTKMPDDTLIVIPLLFLLKKTYPCRPS